MKLLLRIIQRRRFLIGLYILFIRNRNAINLSLFLLLLTLSALYLVRNNLHITQEALVELHQNHIDDASKIISIVRDIFNIVAITIAGIWAYYLFIKGRTFTPKIKVDIFLQHWLNLGSSGIAVVRTRIVNSGKVRIRPLYAKLKAYSAQISSGEIEYVLFKEIDNILIHHFNEKNEILYLEPHDETNLDIDIPMTWLVSSNDLINVENNLQLLVKVYLVDSRYNVWKSYSIITLPNQKEMTYANT